MELRSICVFCGARQGNDPAYAAAAATLGRTLAEQGIRLVYGGGAVGLMGLVAAPAFAQDKDEDARTLDRIVVTGSRI